MPVSRQHGRRPTRWIALAVCALSCVLPAGCALPGRGGSALGWLRPQPPPVLSPEDSCEEIVAYLNRDIERIQSWRSTDASIQTRGPGGVPVRLAAKIAVESPRRFRLRATSLGGDEADFGSNQDRFWFWMRRGDRYVMTARYDDLPLVQARMNLPFQPDWLVEALGTVPLDPRAYTLDRSTSDENTVLLVADRRLPNGRAVRQLITVDTRKGVIVDHSLRDAEGRVLAQASFQDHRQDKQTGILLPRRIDLYWPQVEQRLTLHLGTVEVNPSQIPEWMWELPRNPDYPPFDMGARLRRSQPVVRRERPRRISEVPSSRPPFKEDDWMGQAPRETPPWAEPPSFEEHEPDFEEETPQRRSPIWPVQNLFSRN